MSNQQFGHTEGMLADDHDRDTLRVVLVAVHGPFKTYMSSDVRKKFGEELVSSFVSLCFVSTPSASCPLVANHLCHRHKSNTPRN